MVITRQAPGRGLFAQSARAREVIPVSADRKLVVPSFRIEMRDGSPQSSSAAGAAPADTTLSWSYRHPRTQNFQNRG